MFNKVHRKNVGDWRLSRSRRRVCTYLEILNFGSRLRFCTNASCGYYDMVHQWPMEVGSIQSPMGPALGPALNIARREKGYLTFYGSLNRWYCIKNSGAYFLIRLNKEHISVKVKYVKQECSDYIMVTNRKFQPPVVTLIACSLFWKQFARDQIHDWVKSHKKRMKIKDLNAGNIEKVLKEQNLIYVLVFDKIMYSVNIPAYL